MTTLRVTTATISEFANHIGFQALAKYDHRTPALDNDLNVTSVTDVSTGKFEPQWTNAITTPYPTQYTGNQRSIISGSMNSHGLESDSAGVPLVHTTADTRFAVQAESGAGIDSDHGIVHVVGGSLV